VKQPMNAIEYVAACWVPGAGGFLSGNENENENEKEN